MLSVKRKMIFLLAALMLFAAGITACKSSDEPGDQDIDIKQEAGSISSRREGVYRESLPYSGRFAASDTGLYSFHPVQVNGKSYNVLFYTDYGSDTLVRVCSRPDCAHNDEACDAYLPEASVITYENDHLYYEEVSARSNTDYRVSLKIFRTDPDGRNRVCVMDTQTDARFDDGDFGYPAFTDGMFFFRYFWLNERGEEQSQAYCYRLEGSQNEFQAVDVPLLFGTDGSATFFWLPAETITYYLWDAEEMKAKPLFTLNPETSCYMAEKNAYILTDNKIYRKDYETGEETLLFDTGLTGTHRMRCFPDCIAIIDGVAFDGSEPEIEQQTLRFYSWEFEPLGEITLDYAILQGRTSPICAETPDKLLLSTDYRFLPQYYIDKAELGTGNLTLHELKLPEAMLGE